MTIVVVGGTTGLGGEIRSHLMSHKHAMVSIGKNEGYDICNTQSILDVFSRITWDVRIVGEPNRDLIVLNAFDYSHPEAQQNLFDALWERYKNAAVTFIVMGSTARMWIWSASNDDTDRSRIAKSYAKAKKKLHESVFYKVWEDTTKANAILIEPSFVENVIHHFEDKGQLYLSHKELLSIIDAGLSLSKFMKLVVISGKGLHPASDFK